MAVMDETPQTLQRRLVLVEDEPMTTALLMKVLTGEGFTVQAASDVADARELVMDFDPNCVLVVLRDQTREVRHDIDPGRPLGALTEHQMEVLRLMALGYTNDTIATMKGAGRSTVERWIAGILKVMGIDPRGEVNPRVEAVRRYVAVAGIPERP
jgi:CheY-like chemotaxis protein